MHVVHQRMSYRITSLKVKSRFSHKYEMSRVTMILYNLITNEETGKLLVSANRDLTNRLFIFFFREVIFFGFAMNRSHCTFSTSYLLSL